VQDRPKYIGSLGSVFGVTSILGPILGGYLTAITVCIILESIQKD
jgi:MFS family permease